MEANSGRRRLLALLLAIIPIAMFSVALWTLYNQLHHWRLSDISQSISRIPPARIALALGLTVLGYLVLTLYDVLALRHISRPLPFGKTAQASFISTAISYNVGFNVLASGSLRLRLYTGFGLSAFEAGQIIPFCTITFWTGYLFLGGLSLIFFRLPLPPGVSLHPSAIPVVGAALWALLAAYAGLSFLRKTIRIRGYEFPIPRPRMVLLQILVSSLDWLCASAVLFVLLPSGSPIGLFTLLGMFLLAQIVGLVSSLPGGIGVFEGMMLFLLAPSLGAVGVTGVLIVYRIIYYFVPFIAALLLFAVRELRQRSAQLASFGKAVASILSSIIPPVFAVLSFVGGIVLLVSIATPPIQSRLEVLLDFIPLPVVEMSTFLGSVAGALLLVLALGLWRRSRGAWILALGMLLAGSLFSLLKALDFEEASILLGMFLLLLPCRRYFRRRSPAFRAHGAWRWFLAVSVGLAGALWLGIFSYTHVEYSHELWWQFSLDSHASRSLRAAGGAAVVAIAFGVSQLLRPGSRRLALPDAGQLEQAKRIVDASPFTDGNLALLGDKHLLFSETRKAFLMYAVSGRSWIAMGDPSGEPPEAKELAWRFHELCDASGAWTVFYQVRSSSLPLYIDLGLTLYKIGEEARVPLEGFSMEGQAFKKRRHTVNHMESEGHSFEIIPPERTAEMMQALRAISEAWLAEKHTREKRFSLGFFKEDYLRLCPIAVVRKAGAVVAFANLWLSGGGEELSIDLMRYAPGVSENMMDYLFLQLMAWGRGQGYRWFNLGMATLSGLEERLFAPLWNRLGTRVFRAGEHFYNFQGLRNYKEKFHPVWEPRYLATSRGFALPVIVMNLASLIAGGARGIVTK
jgi:phosphatidylglycerol lysyltransferase